MLRVEDHDGVALLRLQRGKGNSLDTAFLREIRAALDRCRGAGALVLTGEGRFFSAGLDLVTLSAFDPPAMEALLEALQDAFLGLFAFPRPTVAAVNGHAIAGGCVLALCCDYRVQAAGDARIGLNELALGVGLPASVQEIARAQAGPGWLAEVALGAGLHAPDEALRRGLVHEVVAPERVLPEALARARAWAGHPAAAFADAKLALRRPALEEVARLRAEGADARWIARWFAPETRARVAAVVARLR